VNRTKVLLYNIEYLGFDRMELRLHWRQQLYVVVAVPVAVVIAVQNRPRIYSIDRARYV